MKALLIDLDGALGDTRPLWRDWLADAARVLPLDPSALPADRGAAAAALDAAGAGNWRVLLERLDRIVEQLERIDHRLEAQEGFLHVSRELRALNESLGAVAYAALGQRPQVRRRTGS